MKPPLMPITSDRSTLAGESHAAHATPVCASHSPNRACRPPPAPRRRSTMRASSVTPFHTLFQLGTHPTMVSCSALFAIATCCSFALRFFQPGTAVMNREINGLEFLRLTEPIEDRVSLGCLSRTRTRAPAHPACTHVALVRLPCCYPATALHHKARRAAALHPPGFKIVGRWGYAVPWGPFPEARAPRPGGVMIKASPAIDLGARYPAGAHSMPQQDDCPWTSFPHLPHTQAPT